MAHNLITMLKQICLHWNEHVVCWQNQMQKGSPEKNSYINNVLFGKSSQKRWVLNDVVFFQHSRTIGPLTFFKQGCQEQKTVHVLGREEDGTAAVWLREKQKPSGFTQGQGQPTLKAPKHRERANTSGTLGANHIHPPRIYFPAFFQKLGVVCKIGCVNYYMFSQLFPRGDMPKANPSFWLI